MDIELIVKTTVPLIDIGPCKNFILNGKLYAVLKAERGQWIKCFDFEACDVIPQGRNQPVYPVEKVKVSATVLKMEQG